MKIGFIGLGKMGKAMVLQMLEKGVDVVAYNRTSKITNELKRVIPSAVEESLANASSEKLRDPSTTSRFDKDSAQDDMNGFGKLIPTYSISELASKLDSPRIIWIMVEHGKPVDLVIEQLIKDGVGKGDIIIDGGNSYYKDSILRFAELRKRGIHFLDIGTSGGLEGARQGACVMVGGDEAIFHIVKPVLEKISVPGGVAYFGPAGAGHFVKMVHNGIEYGMLAAIGEGFEILSKGMPVTKPFVRAPLGKGGETIQLDLHQVALNFTKGSVVRGWLMELLERALNSKQKTINNKQEWLGEYDGKVGGGSTGEWAVKTAYELGVDVPVIAKSLLARKKSQGKPTFAGKVVSALRREFGGHIEEKNSKIKSQKSKPSE